MQVLEAGGNAVLAFSITLDLEGEESGLIVARGLGTCVKLRPFAIGSSDTLMCPNGFSLIADTGGAICAAGMLHHASLPGGGVIEETIGASLIDVTLAGGVGGCLASRPHGGSEMPPISLAMSANMGVPSVGSLPECAGGAAPLPPLEPISPRVQVSVEPNVAGLAQHAQLPAPANLPPPIQSPTVAPHLRSPRSHATDPIAIRQQLWGSGKVLCATTSTPSQPAQDFGHSSCAPASISWGSTIGSPAVAMSPADGAPSPLLSSTPGGTASAAMAAAVGMGMGVESLTGALATGIGGGGAMLGSSMGAQGLALGNSLGSALGGSVCAPPPLSRPLSALSPAHLAPCCYSPGRTSPCTWPSAGLEARVKLPAAERDDADGTSGLGVGTEGRGGSQRTGRRRSARTVSDIALLTMESFPQHVPVRVGGVVSARSVKLLASSREHQLTRDAWWSELRGEIRAHARSLSCNTVIGYSETVSLHDELAILSASGTAVRMRLPDEELSKREAGLPPHPAMPLHAGLAAAAAGAGRRVPSPCTIGHTPYAPSDAPFPVRIEPCAMCKRKHVPELLLATIDKPPWLPALKEPCLIQARVCRQKKRLQGESHATAVSQALPFLEYDLHRQLQHKLKIHGKNALFGLRLSVTVGESLMFATAEGTALCLPFLPPTRPLTIRRNLEVIDEEDKHLVDLQRQIEAISLHSASAHAAHAAKFSRQIDQKQQLAFQAALPVQLPDGSFLPGIGSMTAAPVMADGANTEAMPFGGGAPPPERHVSGQSQMSSGSLRTRNNGGQSNFPSSSCSNGAGVGRVGMSSAESGGGAGAEGAGRNGNDTGMAGNRGNDDEQAGERLACICADGDVASSSSSEDDDRDDKSSTVAYAMAGGAVAAEAKPAFVVDVDDEMDEDMTAILLDPPLPGDPLFFASEAELAAEIATEERRGVAPTQQRLFSLARRLRLDPATIPANRLNQQFSRILHEMHAALAFKVIRMRASAVFKTTTRVSQPSDTEVELQLDALALSYSPEAPVALSRTDSTATRTVAAATKHGAAAPSVAAFVGGVVATDEADVPQPARAASNSTQSASADTWQGSSSGAFSGHKSASAGVEAATQGPSSVSSEPLASQPGVPTATPSESFEVQLVPLSFVPGAITLGVLGPLSLHLIKETWTLREEGGVANFCHAFVAETHALARAHIAARGGNAALNFVTDLKLLHQSTKNHAYGVMHCHADAVVVRSVSGFMCGVVRGGGGEAAVFVG